MKVRIFEEVHFHPVVFRTEFHFSFPIFSGTSAPFRIGLAAAWAFFEKAVKDRKINMETIGSFHMKFLNRTHGVPSNILPNRFFALSNRIKICVMFPGQRFAGTPVRFSPAVEIQKLKQNNVWQWLGHRKVGAMAGACRPQKRPSNPIGANLRSNDGRPAVVLSRVLRRCRK